MNYKKTTLKNGLRIMTVPMKGTQTATVVVMVDVGSRLEKENQAGLSHFVEHMFFKGTKKRPTTQIISEELDSFGGEFNASTSKDKTLYYAKVDSNHICQAFDIISDMFLNSKIEQAEINRERGTITQEINMYLDLPGKTVGDEFEKLLYKNSSLGREIIGYKKTVSRFKRKDFIKYIRENYNASNTVICVAGKFDEKKIIADAKKYFGKFSKGKTTKISKVSEKQNKPEVRIKFKKTDQTHFVIGNRAYHRDHKDRYALALLATILGGNMSSRLFIEVRERRGLAYSVHSGVDAYQDCGYIATQAGVEHDKLEQAINVILKEYKKIATEKVSQRELKKAKDFLKGRGVMGFEASDEVAMFYVSQETDREKVLNLKDVFAKINAVTAEDILRVAKDVFQNKKLNCAIVGPHKNSKKIQKILNL
ncbi:MAG TPA: pitrilysin family protein [Candidatus Moranbacteria bacterium]|nr:pitrilysin family protein [Candidatus Moranbacteria bacterium]HRZ34096.1 pitrilysin family protein [Candidatus Moranbacteria bacterium]